MRKEGTITINLLNVGYVLVDWIEVAPDTVSRLCYNDGEKISFLPTQSN